MSLLNFNFVVIYIIHKMLVSLKNLLNFFKDSIFECFFKEYKRLNFYLKNDFFKAYNDEKFKEKEEENIIKNIKNLLRLKKELNYPAIKDLRNLFRLEKETKAIKTRILRGIKNPFDHEEEESYYKAVRASNFQSKKNGDRNKTLS